MMRMPIGECIAENLCVELGPKSCAAQGGALGSENVRRWPLIRTQFLHQGRRFIELARILALYEFGPLVPHVLELLQRVCGYWQQPAPRPYRSSRPCMWTMPMLALVL